MMDRTSRTDYVNRRDAHPARSLYRPPEPVLDFDCEDERFLPGATDGPIWASVQKEAAGRTHRSVHLAQGSRQAPLIRLMTWAVLVVPVMLAGWIVCRLANVQF